MPAFNGERCFQAALRAAVAWDYENKDIVVVNDGSTNDGAIESVKQGHHIASQGSDDEFRPPRIERRCVRWQHNGTLVPHACFHITRVLPNHGRMLPHCGGSGGAYCAEFIGRPPIYEPTVMLHRTIAKAA